MQTRRFTLAGILGAVILLIALALIIQCDGMILS